MPTLVPCGVCMTVHRSFQVTCLVMWGLEGGSRPWALVIGLVLTSFGWWEAYLPYRAAIIVPSLFAFLRDVSIPFIYI